MNVPIILYTTHGCPKCEEARAFLRDRGVAFEDVEVKGNAVAVSELTRLAGHAVVPTLVVGDDVQVGWDPSRADDMLAHPLPPEEDELAVLLDAADDEREER